MSEQNELDLNLSGEETPKEETANVDYLSMDNKVPLADLSDLKAPEPETTVEEEEKESTFDLTLEEKKKYLRAMGNKDITDEEILLLPKEEIEKIKEYVKIKDKKAIIKFVTRKKYVSDEEVKNITDEEFAEMTAKALAMSKFLTYNSKKHYDVKYKKERARRNREVKKSRKAYRKH